MNVYEIENKDINFSLLLKKIEKEELLLQYKKNHKKIAVIVPYSKYVKEKSTIKLGLLKGKAEIKIKDDFKLSEREFLKS
ncbi:MAG TPA: prevent-host-death protein [Lentisphaeria bacterium]|nr:MAG: hypothetical protein A2X47_03725 [Lentisphaerae bacterium GWF2_38_69]HBM15209.1 prevent-host-death protein [Lentisphaeria bacterium]